MGASSSMPDQYTVKMKVDLELFCSHPWFEVARLPVHFQPPGTYGKAVYTLSNNEQSISIANTSIDMKTDQPIKASTILGTAVPIDELNSQLRVSFAWYLPKGKYHIYYLNKLYSTMAVGSPDRKTLWILMSNRANFNRVEINNVILHLQSIGFDTPNLFFSI